MEAGSVCNLETVDYNNAVNRMRDFCVSKGFLEVHTQSRLSILAACEDPQTLATFNYAGQVWPLPQTGQMWLEYELLKNPEAPGFFCISTSYRNEPNPVPGRHDKVFPMFEFELKGDLNDLQMFEIEMLEYLGFGNRDDFFEGNYLDVAKKYGVKELEHKHEESLDKDFHKVYFLKNFPNYTSPFWNMNQNDDGETASKIDVILHGVETIGSAQRSCDPDEMRKQFMTISEGGYSNTLFSQFTKERVLKELDDFLTFEFFPRSGGGIGVTRMVRAMKLSKIL
jgi:aspartyl/asparaginyl-tRNA synthetase